MALQGGGGTSTGKKKPAWALMRAGFRRTGVPRGPRAKQPVWKWVRVGSPFYHQLQLKGSPIKSTKRSWKRPGAGLTGHTPLTNQQLNSGGKGSKGGGGSNSGGPGAGGGPDGKGGPGTGPNSRGGGGKRKKKGGGGGGGGGGKSGAGKNYRTVGNKIGKTKMGTKFDTGWLANQMAHLDPKFADSMAGIQFDPSIREMQVALQRAPVQGAQNLHDIDKWYGDVLGMQDTAAQGSAAATEAGAAGMDGATQALLQSLGGESNPAGGMIAAQGNDQSALMRALGAVDSSYNASMRPLLAAEGAGARSRENARQGTAEQDLRIALSNLRGQRGQAESNNLLELSKYNEDARMQGLDRWMQAHQYNNSLDQQGFQNNLAKQEASIAAAMAGMDLDLKAKELRAPTAGAGSGHIGWLKLAAPQKNELIQAALGQVIDQYGGLLYRNPEVARHKMRKYLMGMGYKNAKNFGPGPGGGAKKKNKKANTQIEQMMDAALQRALQARNANAAAAAAG